MRASRLVALLLHLQNRGRMTAEELAATLEVSPRTIYRDVEALSAAGVPIWAERGPGGGIQLVEGYRTRLTGLTSEEASAVMLSGLSGPAAELGLGTVLAAAELKVLAALPPELRGRAARVRARFHLDAPGWFRSADALPQLAPIAAATWEDRRLRIRYRRAEGVVERTIDPLGLVLKAGIWYLVGRRDGLFRTYRVSRIVAAEATGERFERPADFDLGAFWAAATARFERGGDAALGPYLVTLRLAPGAASELASIVGEAAAWAALVEAGPPDAEGWRTVTIDLERPGWAHEVLLRLGEGAEVLRPPELRARLAATARSLLARYGVGDGSGGGAAVDPSICPSSAAAVEGIVAPSWTSNGPDRERRPRRRRRRPRLRPRPPSS